MVYLTHPQHTTSTKVSQAENRSGRLGMQFPHDFAEAALDEDDTLHLGALADDLVLADVEILRQAARQGLQVHVSHVCQETWP